MSLGIGRAPIYTEEQCSIQHNCLAYSTLNGMRMRIIARAGTGIQF